MYTKLAGRWGEALAAEYLRKKHYKVIGMNYSCRLGEIDIIAKNRHYVIFAEVKMRRDADFAEAKEYVDFGKRRRIRAAALIWLSSNETKLQPRFDVIEIYAPDGMSGKANINHIENAFDFE